MVRNAVYQGGMCPRCEGMGASTTSTSPRSTTRPSRWPTGALLVPGLQHGRLVRPDLQRRRPADGQADRQVHPEGAAEAALRRAGEDQGRGRQPHLRGRAHQGPEVDAVQGRRGDAAARPAVRRARGHLHDLPRLRRHPAVQGGAVLEDQGQEHRRPVRDADQRPGRRGCATSTSRRWRRCSGAAAPARLVRRDRPGLPLPRPAGGHALGRRGPAHQDDPPPRLLAHRRHLRLRRADDRAAPARHRADEPAAAPAARQGQHRPRRRAQARDDRDRRPRGRPRSGGGHRRRRGRLRGHRRGAARERHRDRSPPRRPSARSRSRARRHRA